MFILEAFNCWKIVEGIESEPTKDDIKDGDTLLDAIDRFFRLSLSVGLGLLLGQSVPFVALSATLTAVTCHMSSNLSSCGTDIHGCINCLVIDQIYSSSLEQYRSRNLVQQSTHRSIP